MLTKHTHHIPSASLFVADSHTHPAAPPWLSQVLLLARFWFNAGLFERVQQIHIGRGRAGRYLLPDFLLLMLAYAASSMQSFQLFYQDLKPFSSLLFSTWQREQCPSPSALSRFLAALQPEELDALRSFFFQELLSFGFSSDALGGLFERRGRQLIFFDLDPTYESARQRALVSSELYPKARRHRNKACAPGYQGRKRGQILCSRLTLQQSHTHEWLDSWATPGNTHVFNSLPSVCQRILGYLEHHQLKPEQGILRVDGAFGHANLSKIAHSHHGLGYIVRCVNYGLLKRKELKECLQTQTPVRYEHPESGVIRDLFDCGVLVWKAGEKGAPSIETRLIVARQKHDGVGKVAVGKLQHGWIYELFAMDPTSRALTALDVVSLYFGRSGFESTLHQEDQECDPGRWLSNHPEGQGLFTLVCQHVWNLRLKLGQVSSQAELRQTLWAPKEEENQQEEGDEFICENGIRLEKIGESKSKAARTRAIYDAPTEFCRDCPRKADCQLHENRTREGKSVTLSFQFDREAEERRIRERSRKLQMEPVIWKDWAASKLRREWVLGLERESIEIKQIEQKVVERREAPKWVTRAKRARRRISWKELFQRNQSLAPTVLYHVTFHGMSNESAKVFGIESF